MIVWEVIIWAVILLVVAVILIFVFKNLLGEQQDEIKNQIAGTGDKDHDLVSDTFDRCCTQGGDVDASGCPTSGERTPIECKDVPDNQP